MDPALQLIVGYNIVERVLFAAVAIAGVVGAIMAATVREDAFTAGDRQGKWVWVAILAASSFVVVTRFPFLSWVGMVAIGVYWFDVRPQLRNILSGNYGW